MARVAINGFGRIGRAVFKIMMDTPGLDVVAINDLLPAGSLAYVLNYDTVYGRYKHRAHADGSTLVVGDARIPVFAERDPASLPWQEHAVDLVVESTGLFTTLDKAKGHLVAGAHHVAISAPTKSAELATAVHGVGHPESTEPRIFSCASCTTNSITPVVEIMGRRIGLRKAVLTTVHAYTATQELVDTPTDTLRRGRAAAQNIVPSTTGAAIATTKVLPQYAGRFDGTALRVPVPVGSMSDLTFVTERATTVEEVSAVFREEVATDRYRAVLAVSEEEIVSSDIIGSSYASIVDLTLTQVVDGDLVKVFAWYDNETGYSHQLVREVRQVLGVA